MALAPVNRDSPIAPKPHVMAPVTAPVSAACPMSPPMIAAIATLIAAPMMAAISIGMRMSSMMKMLPDGSTNRIGLLPA